MTRHELSELTRQWLHEHAPEHIAADVRERDQWCTHLERELGLVERFEDEAEKRIDSLKKALEAFPEMTAPKKKEFKTLTIFNSLYHVPQMRLDGTYPPVWVWQVKGRCWARIFHDETGYVHHPEPQRFWSYEDPGDFEIMYTQRDDFAYLEINDGERIYHDLTDKNRLKMPGHMREESNPRFEHKRTKHPIEGHDGYMLADMSGKGWELVSVVNDAGSNSLRYYWKRPDKG